MAFELYDMATLVQVRRQQVDVPVFWLNFFTQTLTFETPYIDFEKVSRRYKKLAPLVSPNVQGKVISGQGSNVTRFAPGYVKPKSVIDPSKVVARQPGESAYAPMSLAAKRDAVIAETTRDHKARHLNRLEWMAANAVINASITLESPDYPLSTVDFGRDASLTIVLTGANKWDQTTAKPITDLKLGKSRVFDLSQQKLSRYIFGQNAWDLFATRMGFDNPQTGNLLDTTFRGSETSVSRLLDGYPGAEFVGTVKGTSGQGAMECWVYHATYEDDAGVEQDLLNTNDVIGLADIQGFRCFGAIMDAEAGYLATEVFMKNWVEKDPSAEYLLSQSAPLMVPGEPNGAFRIRVA